MMDKIPESLRGQSDPSVGLPFQIADFEAKERILELRRQTLQAEIESILKQKEENRSAHKEHERLARLEEVAVKQRQLAEQRYNRQKSFQDSISEEAIMSMKQIIGNDQEFRSALQAITTNQADEKQFTSFKCLLVDEIFGESHDFKQHLAARILEDASESEVDAARILHATEAKDGAAMNSINRPIPVCCKPALQETAHRADHVPQSTQPPGDGDTTSATDNNATSENKILDSVTTAIPDDQDTDTIVILDEASTGPSIESTPLNKVKREFSIETNSPPSSKRCKLTDIENSVEYRQTSEPMQLSFSIDLSDHGGVATAPSTPITQKAPSHSVNKSGSAHQLATPLRDRSGFPRSNTDSKRSTDSSTSTPSTSTPVSSLNKSNPVSQTKKKLSAAKERFTRRLDSFVGTAQSISDELRCQQCHISDQDLKLSACLHLYCVKCLRKIRMVANKSDKVAICITCQNELGRKASVVIKEQIEEWQATYVTAQDDEGDEDEDKDDEDEDTADNTLNDNTDDGDDSNDSDDDDDQEDDEGDDADDV